jgi:hypothetical protein
MWNLRFWRSAEQISRGNYALLRSRFQPVTTGHLEAIKYFFETLSPIIQKQTNRVPTLVLAIVCDLLKGTDLGLEITRLAAGDLRLKQYMARFRPEFNPLMPLEVIEDLFALIHSFKQKDWRERTAITLMPEFGCTVFALHSNEIKADAKYIIKSLLPDADGRRWLIPIFDNDDPKDIQIAEQYSESVDFLSPKTEISEYTFDINGHEGIGLYGYLTSCLLRDQPGQLQKYLPKPVCQRWKAQNIFAMARTRVQDILDDTGKAREVILEELHTSISFKSPVVDHKEQQPPPHPGPGPSTAAGFARDFFGNRFGDE